MFSKCAGFLFLFIIFCNQSLATESNQQIGYIISVNQYSVIDPNGSTKTTVEVVPIHVLWFSKISRDIRYYSEISFDKFQIDGDENNVGQKIELLDFAFALQKRFRLSTKIKPWVGFGLSYSNLKFKTRNTTDDEGFLLQSYPDRTESILNIILNSDITFKIDSDFSFGFRLQHKIPLGDGVNDSSLGFVVSYDM